MKTLFKVLIFSVITLSLTNFAIAGEGEKNKRHGKMIEKTIAHLNLDEGRENEVRIILEENRKARKALTDKRGDEAKALRLQTKKKLESVLTPEEMESLSAFKKNHSKKMKKYKKNKDGKKDKKKYRDDA